MENKIENKLISGLTSLEGTKNNLFKKVKGDHFIWAIVILLALLSLLAIYSTSSALPGSTPESGLIKQLTFTGMGLLLIYGMHKVNYIIYSRIALYLFFLAIILLIYTAIWGELHHGARRGFTIPLINQSFRTSDFARLALFMYLSRQLSRLQYSIKEWNTYLQLIIPVLIVCALILPDNLSTALLTGVASMLLLFIGRVRAKYLIMTAAAGLAFLAILVTTSVVNHKDQHKDNLSIATNIHSDESADEDAEKNIVEKVLKRYATWEGRVQKFLYTDSITEPQVRQSHIAISYGGILFGKGPGNSYQKNYLPQSYDDFIYAIIIEEYGLIAGAILLFIYLIFLYRCIQIFKKCPYAFGAFLSLALSFSLVIQALAHIAVSVNLAPVTGITLPLVSRGGSSLLFTCAAIGIILSVSRKIEQEEGQTAAVVSTVPEVNEEKNGTV